MKRFNLIQLEDNLIDAYKLFREDDNQDTRTVLFKEIEKLAFAVITLGVYGVDVDKVAYEYASYLFERLITGSFKPKAKARFPWQHYMRKNIKHVIFSRNKDRIWYDIIEDIEYLIDNTGAIDFDQESVNQKRKEISVKLLKAIQIFYPMDEIKRLFPLAVELIYSSPYVMISSNAPEDVREFAITLVCLAKKIHNNKNPKYTNKNELKKVIKSSVRSSIFLSTVINSDFFPKEFLLALDIDSLYRLVYALGGQTVRIPTIRELDTLIGAVIFVSKMLTNGKNNIKEKDIRETKKDFDLVFSRQVDTKYFISKIYDTFKVFGEDKKSEPLINIVASSMKSLNELMKKNGTNK